jgi:pyruvate/2-oxoglutarate dehydrogenase complex dihydrolipoamide acyltransferase (E2) component
MSTQTAEDQTAAKEEKARQAAEAKAEKARIAAEKKAAREQERIAKTAAEGEIDLASVEGTGPDSAVTLDDVRKAVKVKRDAERAAKPKKAPMTLSQRRAILKLGEAEQADGSGVVAKTGFNELPLDYLVSVNLATKTPVQIDEPYTVKEPEEYFEGEGEDRVKRVRKVDVPKTRQVEKPEYRLTDAGRDRVKEINPKWLTWKPDNSTASTPAPESMLEPDVAA